MCIYMYKSYKGFPGFEVLLAGLLHDSAGFEAFRKKIFRRHVRALPPNRPGATCHFTSGYCEHDFGRLLLIEPYIEVIGSYSEPTSLETSWVW